MKNVSNASSKLMALHLVMDSSDKCQLSHWYLRQSLLKPLQMVAFSLPLIRVELLGLSLCFVLFFLTALSVGITLALTVLHLYGPDASSPTGMLTVIKCCYVLDLCLLVRLIVASWMGLPLRY